MLNFWTSLFHAYSDAYIINLPVLKTDPETFPDFFLIFKKYFRILH